MNILFLLLVISLVVALGFLAAFVWAVRSGQYEDTRTPGMRVLLDDETDVKPEKTGQGSTGDCPQLADAYYRRSPPPEESDREREGNV